ncbi:hypothetical protein BN2475_110016 [Paraburkholderia ribeironis]|uniref:Uncharacterized protein n=1 Tax=Paraburkholderia ribeironis TaxID=1247936 RepID=A0A1N7RRG9_9BURK|nr:hypothetical protein [Paraburkholderia ribeironis]SIT37282.1 hypothetical protein BN2475_110016 [Paraburkholderia ribeironis]
MRGVAGLANTKAATSGRGGLRASSSRSSYPCPSRRRLAYLPDGLPVCQIADDGVDDPSAVLVQLPHGKNTWWVSAANVQAAD